MVVYGWNIVGIYSNSNTKNNLKSVENFRQENSAFFQNLKNFVVSETGQKSFFKKITVTKNVTNRCKMAQI
ncbi:hypothetical protein WG68_12530 [Arsukibacterium ikkense]|uniref:Uncharacterized protein n=1 Tax=Arsukibacterium ikkense TaxID=336831 RepID=A0A0M2V3H7_9GAMM|nr:hypothetical protein WG68_12530 [Arsukibacterium ikkense]